MELSDTEARHDLERRLKRIEGQVRGVQRMLEDGRDCQAVLQQLAAVRAAVHQASLVLVRAHATECLRHPSPDRTPEQLVEELLGTLAGLPPREVSEG